VRQLQRHLDALDLIAGLIDRRKAALAQLALDRVLAQLLLCAQELPRPALQRRPGSARRWPASVCLRRSRLVIGRHEKESSADVRHKKM